VCDAEDAVAFVAVSGGGVQITGHMSRCAGGVGHRIARYEGTRGTLTLSMPDPADRHRSTLIGQRDGIAPVDLSEPASISHESTHARFIRAVRDRSLRVFTSFADGLEVVRLAEAMRESSESGRWVQITSP
jgi:predicted dehydrogenase